MTNRKTEWMTLQDINKRQNALRKLMDKATAFGSRDCVVRLHSGQIYKTVRLCAAEGQTVILLRKNHRHIVTTTLKNVARVGGAAI